MESNWRMMLADLGLIGPQTWGAELPVTFKLVARLITPLNLPMGVGTHVGAMTVGAATAGVYIRLNTEGAAVEKCCTAGFGNGFPWWNEVYPD